MRPRATPADHEGSAVPCDAEFTAAALRFLRSIEGRPISRDPETCHGALAGFALEQIAQGLIWHALTVAEPATTDSLTHAIRFVQEHRATRLKLAHRQYRADNPALRTACPVCAVPVGAPCILRGRSALYRHAGRAHCARFVLALHRIHPLSPDAEVPA
jgi:hypothetical protein